MTDHDDIKPVITTPRLTLQSTSKPLHCITMVTPTLVYKLYNSGTINTINPSQTLAYLVIYLTVTGNSSCCAYFVVRQSQSVFLESESQSLVNSPLPPCMCTHHHTTILSQPQQVNQQLAFETPPAKRTRATVEPRLKNAIVLINNHCDDEAGFLQGV